MDVVMLYGPPASGKLTIGRELERLTGYKLFHNHISIDWAKTVFDFGTPAFRRLLSRLRDAVVSEAMLEDLSLILTFTYSRPAQSDDIGLATLNSVCQRLSDGGHRALFVRLTCDADTLAQRIDTPERLQMGKLASVPEFRDYASRNVLDAEIAGYQSLVIDTTVTSPEDAARRIVEHYSLPLV